jgi:hypothetical protein
MVKYGGLVSSNAVSCGIYFRESDTKRGLSSSPPVLPSVRTTPPHLNALSSNCHRRHIALAGVRVIDIIKSYKLYCVSPRISSLCFGLSFCPIFAPFCYMFSNIKPPITLQCAGKTDVALPSYLKPFNNRCH